MKRLLLLNVLVLSGCATLTAPKSLWLTVESEPAGAEIRVDGVPAGTTPATVELRKSRETPLVQLAMPGRAPATCPVRTSAGGGYVVADTLMCVFLFPFGCVALIDANGAWNELVHERCALVLSPGADGRDGYVPSTSDLPAPPVEVIPPSL
ncbi:MAG: PEGA domain-containing protein [Myxococcaceae bacterium]|nr:PEGA domain-containing protein [Myxococcaceae bacterium]